MKKILVRYTIEIPEDKFEKFCNKTRTTKKFAIVDLRIMAETAGRTTVYNEIEDVLERK